MVVEVVKQKKFGDVGDSERTIEMRGGVVLVKQQK